MARRQEIPTDIARILAELHTLNREVKRHLSDQEMSQLLARRRALTGKLAVAGARSAAEGLAKLAILCDRLGEDLAPYDVGGRLNLRLARSILRDLKGLA